MLSLIALRLTGASFDCSKAATVPEKTICSDSGLSALDDELTAAYTGLLRQLSPDAASKVRQDEREWLGWLNQVCSAGAQEQPGIATCLANKYSEHLGSLKNGFQRVGAIVFFPRIKLMTAPNKQKPPPGAVYPNLGMGHFSRPEIDRPTPGQSVWIDAVRARVARWENVRDAEVSVSWTVRAANERFIAIDLQESQYDYGAAHPAEDFRSFNWWLERRRPLRADDVFAPGSGWESVVADRAYARLISSSRSQDLYGQDEARKAVPRIVQDTSNWSLNSRELIIEFPEYSVAPRVAGFISAAIPWNQLRAALAPQFDPAMLPQPR